MEGDIAPRTSRFINESLALLDFVVSTWAWLLVYLIAGGIIISLLEAEADIKWKEEQLLKTKQLNFTDEQWEALEVSGLYTRPSFESLEPVWTLSNSVFFLLTCVTTIGYGSMTPRTPGGMVFTCLFSLLGLGFVGTITVRTAEGCIKCIRLLIDDPRQLAQLDLEAKAALHFKNVDLDQKGTINREQLANMLKTLSYGQVPGDDLVDAVFEAAADELGLITEARFPLAVAAYYKETKGDPGNQSQILTIAVILFLLIWLSGAAVFMQLEGWSYVESVWFGFATITTIGFGDFTPGTLEGECFAYLYVILGLGMGALVISASSDVVEARQRRLDSSVRQVLRPGVDRIKSMGWGLLPSSAKAILKERKLA